MYALAGKKVFVAGHKGMVGSAIVRRLAEEDCEVLTLDRGEVDLRDQDGVRRWMLDRRPDAIFMAAAKVGGILANNDYPADFLLDNLLIETAMTAAAHAAEVEKMLFLGSSCIYPKFAPQPIPEDALLTGPLEATNEWYAIAKIAGIKLAQAFRKQYGRDYISAMPTNLYGPGDNFDLEHSHVIPALMRKAHEAKMIGAPAMVVWGTGAPRREFLHVDDLADAALHLMEHYSEATTINVGVGKDVTIKELVTIICDVVGFEGELEFDTSRPDGTPQKMLDIARLRSIGWTPNVELRDGLATTYAWFLENIDQLRAAE